MKEEKRNPLIKLRERLQELSGGLCDIGPGPYGIGASAVSSSEIGFHLVFDPKCYTETEIFPKEILEYKVTVQGFYHSDGRAVKPEELEKLAETEKPDTVKVAKMLKELEGQDIKASSEECIEAFGMMTEEIREELEREPATENQSEGMEMTQQF